MASYLHPGKLATFERQTRSQHANAAEVEASEVASLIGTAFAIDGWADNLENRRRFHTHTHARRLYKET